MEYLDIDWFAVDVKDNIIHFASGGGYLPASVYNHMEDNESVVRFFKTLQNNNDVIKVNEDLESLKLWVNTAQKDRYLRSYVEYAFKGLFSFDKADFNNPFDKAYRLIVSPVKCLTIDKVPQPIANIIKRATYSNDISKIKNLSIDEIKSVDNNSEI